MDADPNENVDANPVVNECIEEALAPYRDLLPPEVLAGFAETLDLFLTTHPVAAPMLERLRPRRVPTSSMDVDRSSAPKAGEAQAYRDGGEAAVSYSHGGMLARLTPEQQTTVLMAKPMVEAMLKKLRRMFRHVLFEDMSQIVWQGVSEAAPHHDPSQGSFAAFAWKRVYGKAVDEAMREARQSPLYLARRAFVPETDQLKDPDDPFCDDEETLSPVKEVCHDATSRMFFGATFETWRIQGEQGLVDHMIRLKAFRALQSAFTMLSPDEWKLLELYYIDCHSWLEVGKALGIGERHAKRRAEEIREALKRELRVRGVKEAPPPEG